MYDFQSLNITSIHTHFMFFVNIIIDTNLLCYWVCLLKVLDEIKCILNVVETNQSPPRPLQLLQELRDLSSMAIEHFDEHILPRCREKLEQQSGIWLISSGFFSTVVTVVNLTNKVSFGKKVQVTICYTF